MDNPHASTMSSRIREFSRMNPPVYFGSKSNEDPKEFMHEIYKILCAMGVNENDKAELVVYQLNDLAQVWYKSIAMAEMVQGTISKVIVLLLGTQMPKRTSLAPKRAVIAMTNIAAISLVNVVVCIEVSVWQVLIGTMGAARVGNG